MFVLHGCETSTVAQTREVILVSFGDVPQADVDVATRALSDQYNVAISFEVVELPASAFYQPRLRYRAEKLLAFLEESFPGYDRVVGLTTKDISTTSGEHEDWGIFGLGRISGQSAVISTHRLSKEGVKKNVFGDRLYKVVLHEYGHTVGLQHCKALDTCPRQDANGKVKTVDKSVKVLCESCLGDVQSDVRREGA